MTDLVSPAGSPALPTRTRATRTVRSSLRTRIRVYAVVGSLIVGGWLYYTIRAVLGLYDATLQTTLYTDLRHRVTDALWPDFRARHLLEAVLDYQRRDRRYGAIGSQPVEAGR